MVSALLLPPPFHDTRIWGGFAEHFHPHPGRPDVVVAAGAGASAAVETALAHEARSAVLVAPWCAPLEEVELPDPDERLDDALAAVPSGIPDAIWRRDARTYAQLMSSEYADTLAAGDVFLLRRVLADNAEEFFDAAPPGDPHWPDRLPLVDVPVLVIAATHLADGMHEQICRALARRCPQGTFVGVPAASEYPWLERTDEIADLVLAWAHGALEDAT